MRTPRSALVLQLVVAALLLAGAAGREVSAQSRDGVVVLSWNDLGMHCMNRDHANISILPPYNTLNAQVVQTGDHVTAPQLVTAGLTLEYSVPGNTYSAGKTDFWDYAFHIFGVDLPPDVGLTGNGLSGEFEFAGGRYVAEGIPLTPFTDADPAVEDPYQLALVIARDGQGVEVGRSTPVVPVSTEVNCLGCHASESDIINGHDDEAPGYDPNDRPVFCSGCHSSPALGTPLDPDAGYLSYRIHEKHSFIDEQMPGIAGCNMCHPGEQTACLRGTMSQDYGMVCQDCHGNMQTMHQSISGGRIPWVDEPSCRGCHTATYGEPVGQLYRNSTGHGGLMCSACHGSPHAIFPSREERDNQNDTVLQGHAGTLSDCTVCHGIVPDGAGPHGYNPATGAAGSELSADGRLAAYPNPLRVGGTCVIEARTPDDPGSAGRVLVFDAAGRTVRLLRATSDGNGLVRANWDGRDGSGRGVASGTYFVQWRRGDRMATGKVLVMN